MNFTEKDEHFMRQALLLARQGVALASPNPRVGAVVVSGSGEVAGSGFHTYDGVKHAEVIALEQAGAKARGGTLYLNLEPCSHQGRTPPCADAVIAAGISRVVAAMADPNPQVAGQGFAKLINAGIQLEVGLMEGEARKLNEAFAKYILTRLPLVTLKSGMTLDGKIAGPQGSSVNSPQHAKRVPGTPVNAPMHEPSGAIAWITSEQARAHVQELRHESDAIMVGVGTVIADDPLLTDRTGLPRRRGLRRVVLDSRLRLPLDSRVVKTVKDDVLVLCSFAEEKKKRELEARGVRVEQVALGGADGRPDLHKAMARLGELEITSVLVEGGALLNWAALAAGVVDKVFFYYAPKILGGPGSVPFATGAGFRHLSEAALVKNIVLHRFGEDFAVEGYLRDPYSAALTSTDAKDAK
ncbi:MAG: bifunctional diaminohydroxyphosphoribosylaminopyrimidine deaminase/5-amino-6-(5-phosphoribosylamino)uracil reductase RibD [Acidobacteriia bacterium]|nr:bifunctional diaminohydroxyphosphoribosylaminopyrimidine deaminase/5-amino-6-(5-phosphoribosylamino)uracil reductase RibD [Terriglobia bacterium]